MKSPSWALLGLAATSALLLSACGGVGGADSGSDSRPSVVASFYPLAFVATQVGGDHVQVDNLTRPGVEPHDLELEPQQIGAIQDADLIVYENGFQAAVDDAVDQASLKKSARLDVADLVQLDKAAAPEHGADEHDHAALDPHVWLDPHNMITITKAVTKRLSEADEEHAASYRRNGKALVADLTALDNAYRTGLKTCTTRKIVTSHAAFGYLARAYGLEQIPITGIDPSSEPSGAQLAQITRTVKNAGITTVFTEDLVSPKIAETIAHETGATTATLNPIEGLSDDTAGQTYLTLMKKNLHEIQKANHCS